MVHTVNILKRLEGVIFKPFLLFKLEDYGKIPNQIDEVLNGLRKIFSFSSLNAVGDGVLFEFPDALRNIGMRLFYPSFCFVPI